MSSSASKPKKCALVGKPCIEHQCQHYVHLLGKHPQTNDPVDKWECAFVAQVMLMMEMGRAVHNLGGEISALREEENKRGSASAAAVNNSAEAVNGLRSIIEAAAGRRALEAHSEDERPN